MAQRHGILLLPRCPMLALAGLLEALAAANELLDSTAYAPLLLSLDGQPVAAEGGSVIGPTTAFHGAGALHGVFVIAEQPLPDGVRDGHAPALHPWLRAHAAAGAVLGGIGNGSAVLAQAGLLDGHRATLHWAHVEALAEQHVQVVWSSNLYEIDRGRLSCPGGTASLDMAIAWLGSRHGERLRQELLAHFGLERLRDGSERQRTPIAARIGSGSAKLTEAVALMEANLGEPLPTEDIARLVGVSRRQLERLFKQHLDELPSRYYAELRLKRARRLLQQTQQSILQIGLGCGFSSGSHFSNAYRLRFGRTPREERSPRAMAWRQQPAGSAATDPPPAPEAP